MQEEIWKPIKYYEGCYEVSNLGNVKSLRSGIILKPRKRKQSENYNQVTVNLSRWNKNKTHLISRLVATAFCPNPKHKKCVNHIDFNPENNNANNLEWVTQKENMEHSQKAGRLKREVENDPKKIIIIKYLYDNGFSFHEISRLYQQNMLTIKKIYTTYCV